MTTVSQTELLQIAIEASQHAYCPYSKIKVGAALLTASGKIYTGSNVESGSFGLSCCAERVALFKAVSEGEKSFLKLAIISTRESIIPPCGACRQVLSEWGEEIELILGNAQGDADTTSLKKLFPNPFRIS